MDDSPVKERYVSEHQSSNRLCHCGLNAISIICVMSARLETIHNVQFHPSRHAPRVCTVLERW